MTIGTMMGMTTGMTTINIFQKFFQNPDFARWIPYSVNVRGRDQTLAIIS